MTRGWLFVTLALLGCAPEADERAARDETVGLDTGPHGAVVVEEGRAVVRAQTAEAIQLWANAPAFALTVTRATAGDVLLEVRNAMPEAELRGAPHVELASDEPTVRRWRVSLSADPTRLRLAPPEDAAADRSASWRFGFLADIQDGIDGVQDVFATLNAQPDLRFVLGAGDITQDGTREEMARFEGELAGLERPFYSTLGNHDVIEGTRWHEVFGRGSYRFLFRGVQFSLVDSASATLAPQARRWLDGWLAEGRRRTHVVAMHIPLLDPVGVRNGAFGSRAEAGSVVAAMAEGGVDLALYGHIHSFYAFEHGGIPAYIAGGGGAFPERLDGYERHVMVVEVAADGGVLDAVYVGVPGG